jgi:preprotein translocase subunit SecD
MGKDLRWRTLLIVVIVGACLWAIIPPAKKIRLGLDLRGGVHLVLRVNTDDALRLETVTTMERVRDELDRAGVTVGGVKDLNPTQFQVSGVSPQQDGLFRQTVTEAQANFNRESGVGGAYTFTMKPNIVVQLRGDAVTQAKQTIERRVNDLGVTEPIVALQGTAGDQLLVQLPGVTDVQRAKDIIHSTAMLELKLVEQGPMPTREALLQATNGQVPPNMEVVPGVDTRSGERPETVYLLVRKAPVVTGRDLRNAKPSLDQNNQPAVSFTLNNEGARKFSKATGENVNRNLAIVLDGQARSWPRIENRISDQGQITGGFTQQ